MFNVAPIELLHAKPPYNADGTFWDRDLERRVFARNARRIPSKSPWSGSVLVNNFETGLKLLRWIRGLTTTESAKPTRAIEL